MPINKVVKKKNLETKKSATDIAKNIFKNSKGKKPSKIAQKAAKSSTKGVDSKKLTKNVFSKKRAMEDFTKGMTKSKKPLTKAEKKMKEKTSIKSRYAAPKKKSMGKTKFSGQSPDKKKKKADALCSHIKNKVKRDKCYKDKGVFTPKMKKNNKKLLEKAKLKCGKVKGLQAKKRCQDDIIKGTKTTFNLNQKASAKQTEANKLSIQRKLAEAQAKRKIESEI